MSNNANVAPTLDLIPEAFDTFKSEGWQMKKCWIMMRKTPASKPRSFAKCMKLVMRTYEF